MCDCGTQKCCREVFQDGCLVNKSYIDVEASKDGGNFLLLRNGGVLRERGGFSFFFTYIV